MAFLISQNNSFSNENKIKIIFIFLLNLKINLPHSEHIEPEICDFFLHNFKLSFYLVSCFAHNM